VKIQHTRDEDIKWFYGTVALFPTLILLLGLVLVRIRRRA